jgi:hypothetical protein
VVVGDYSVVNFDYRTHLFDPIMTSSPKTLTLIQRISVEEEARIALCFQYYILSRCSPIGEQFIRNNDPEQSWLYQYSFSDVIGFRLRDSLRQLFDGIVRVGFLSVETSLIPGAVEAWLEAVNYKTGFFYSSDVEEGDFHFFSFTPNSARYIGSVDSILKA